MTDTLRSLMGDIISRCDAGAGDDYEICITQGTLNRWFDQLSFVVDGDHAEWQDTLDKWANEKLPSETASCITCWSDRIAEFIVCRLSELPLSRTPSPVGGSGK